MRNDAGFIDFLSHFDESIVSDESNLGEVLILKEFLFASDINKYHWIEVLRMEIFQCFFESRVAGFWGDVSFDSKDV